MAMTTTMQAVANRRNAAKSTGPRTAEGKAISAGNAVTHGLLAGQVVLPDESHEHFGAFREEFMGDLSPIGALENVLADRAAAMVWRLRRAAKFEERMIDAELELDRAGGFTVEIMGLDDEGEKTKDAGLSDRRTAAVKATTSCMAKGTYAKICRYECHIERAMYRALHELQRRQARRLGEPVSAPIAVDIMGLGPV